MKESRIIKFLITSLAIFISAMILPGVDVAYVWVAMAIAAILAVLNTIVKPLLVILTLPVTIVTLGLFLFIINGCIILLADALIPDTYFHVSSIWMAIIFSLLISFTTTVLEKILGVKDDKK